jgi:hypothetical protein
VPLLKVPQGGLVSPPHNEVSFPIEEFRYRSESPAVKSFQSHFRGSFTNIVSAVQSPKVGCRPVLFVKKHGEFCNIRGRESRRGQEEPLYGRLYTAVRPRKTAAVRPGLQVDQFPGIRRDRRTRVAGSASLHAVPA